MPMPIIDQTPVSKPRRRYSLVTVRIHGLSHIAQINNSQSTRQVEVCLSRGSNATENESDRIQASSCKRRDQCNYRPARGARNSYSRPGSPLLATQRRQV